MNKRISKITRDEKYYSVCLLYTKQLSYELDLKLRNIILRGYSKEEVLWKAIREYRKEMGGYSIAMDVVIEII